MIKRPGLIVLLYAFKVVVGLLVTWPVYNALNSATGRSGFSPELADQFDITVWTDVIEQILPAMQGFLAQLLWIIPLVLIWKAVSSVGVITTLSTDGLRSFWHGVGEYGGRAVLLSLLFLIPVVVLFVGMALLVTAATAVWPGEVSVFWINVVFLPIGCVAGLAALDLMHDFSRMELVLSERGVVRSFFGGLKWPFRHVSSIWIYLPWFLVSVAVLFSTTLIDIQPGGLWGVFILQQLLLLVRAGITVGWFGSEASYYDSIGYAALPAIATVEPEPAPPFETA